MVTREDTRAALVSAWEVPVAAGAAPVYESVISGHRPAAVAAARVLLDAARAAGAEPPADVARLLDEPGRETAAVDADRMWLRALAHLDARLAAQWLRSASISSDFFIVERPSIPSSPARLRSSSTVRSS